MADSVLTEEPTRYAGADTLMRRLLFIPDRPDAVDEAQVQRLFSASILLSATRCLLSYVLLPIVLPAIGLASGIGPYIGIPVGVVALVFDVKGMRRFWLAGHRHRWAFTALYAAVGTMVAALVVVDLAHLLG